jgi:hypothetical protein
MLYMPEPANNKYIHDYIFEITILMKHLIRLPLILTIAILSACDFEADNSLQGVPAEGFFAAVGANQHSGLTDVQVGAAVFADGQPINLVGGDAFEASTSAESVLLLKRGFYVGTYVGDLPNTANLSDVNIEIIHDNQAVTEARWYPIEMFNIDPGPGELVGGSASLVLPPAPTITMPQQNTVFDSIDSTITLNWDAGADAIKVRSHVTCSNGVQELSYGAEATLADESDDGTETIALDQFIFDSALENPAVRFITGEARALLQELLVQLSAGSADENFFKEIFPINPIENNCEIRLFMFRVRPGSFASPTTNGIIIGSRSDEVTILYQPTGVPNPQ